MKFNKFDLHFSSDTKLPNSTVPNLASLIFNKLPHREERSDIIKSHVGSTLVTVSLAQLRSLCYLLFCDFSKKGIKSGDTVLLLSMQGNNELFVAIMFTALTSYGVRVLLPMFTETSELKDWIKIAQCSHAIIPMKEISALNHHEKEKHIIKSVDQVLKSTEIKCFDSFTDFHLDSLLFDEIPDVSFKDKKPVIRALNNTDHRTESLIITTSGSSGQSKLIVYPQGSFIKSCLSWQVADFFNRKKLGGCGFTPLFTHTMGIRAHFNAIWTGVPMCLINTEWFNEKSETVRYFLMQMKPEHITGGPAVYDLFLELMRNYPELKIQLKYSLKTLISSGAPIKQTVANTIHSSLGLTMFNALGITETQQVTNTLLCKNLNRVSPKSLGYPLPGVEIGLQNISSKGNLYKLYVKSPFGATKLLTNKGESSLTTNGFFDTGDIVQVHKNEIEYHSRETQDFFKDGFGVKIPLIKVNKYYKDILKYVFHIELFAIKNTPGLCALLFIPNESSTERIISDVKLMNKYAHHIEEINSTLYKTLEPFEYRHRVIKRFVIINKTVPKTEKGTLSRYKIEKSFKDIINELINPLSSVVWIKEVERQVFSKDVYSKNLNPYIGEMLSCMGLDYTFHRANKDYIYTYKNGIEIKITDFVGGYGTNLLGHNHKVLKDFANSLGKTSYIPLSDQGSIQSHAGMLAEELNVVIGRLTGKSYYTLFGSTGSEAVEIALHHAVFEWQNKIRKLEKQQFQKLGSKVGSIRRIWKNNWDIINSAPVHVITSKNAFHGSTSGARSILGDPKRREPFKNILGISPIIINDTSPSAKKQIDKIVNTTGIRITILKYKDGEIIKSELFLSTVIAAIVEPIQGEGGVRTISKKYLNYLSNYDFPLIMDEIQCGLGRSGSLLASKGVDADYYTFGKALGGGLVKISATLIDKQRYINEFGKHYISTFSGGGGASQIALKTLKIIIEEKIPDLASRKGNYLKKGLNGIRKQYPDIIESITGKGLMLGIKLSYHNRDNILLRILYNNELLGYLVSSYLFTNHNIRVLPTISAPNNLRVQPSAYISNSEMDHFVVAVEDVACKINNNDLYTLTKHLMDGDEFIDNKGLIPENGYLYTNVDKPKMNSKKVAFIIHFAHPTKELRMIDRSLSQASDTGLRILFKRFQLMMEMKPFILFAQHIYKKQIHFSVIALPLDSAELEKLHRKGKRQRVVGKIQQAVDLAAKNGASIIGLGGYNSILSNDGLSITPPLGTKIVSGNTFTAAALIKKIIFEVTKRNEFKRNNKIAIVGATGNIGSVLSKKITEYDYLFKKVILISNNTLELEKLLKSLQEKCSRKIKIEASNKLKSILECNVVISTTNTNDPIIFSHHLNKNFPVLVLDISVPPAFSPDIEKLENVISIPHASYVYLPEDPDFILSPHTPKGTVFCCAAEAILCSLDQVNFPLVGEISSLALDKITKIAVQNNLLLK